MIRYSILFVVALAASAAEPGFLRRQLGDVRPQADDLTAGAKGASYKPLFGIGDADAGRMKAVARYGELTVDPGGASAVVGYPAEEQLYFVTEGAGTLIYGNEKAAIRTHDFMYLPPGVRHGVANASSGPVRVVVMGYRIPAGREVTPPARLMLANAGDVPLQVLGQHGPTTQFKLLVGLASSRRDKLAAATVMNSLFLMDFAPGGTNIPHNHPREEEIYLLLRGSGDMVAGRDVDGKEIRHATTAGTAFYFNPGTQVGYYSHAREGQEHDLILAVRSYLPDGQTPRAQ